MWNSTSKCDGLTCGPVVITTVQDLSVVDNNNVNLDFGDCVSAQVVPKVHHTKKSSITGLGCIQGMQHPEKRNRMPRNSNTVIVGPTKQLSVEDGCLQVVV